MCIETSLGVGEGRVDRDKSRCRREECGERQAQVQERGVWIATSPGVGEGSVDRDKPRCRRGKCGWLAASVGEKVWSQLCAVCTVQ